MLENSSIDRRLATSRPRNLRSKITNRPRRMAIDGRSALGRRVRDLAESYAEELGGWATLTDTQTAAVRAAAEMTALYEKARHDALVEGRADPDALVRLEGASNRAIRRLGLDVRRRGSRQSAASPLSVMITRAREVRP